VVPGANAQRERIIRSVRETPTGGPGSSGGGAGQGFTIKLRDKRSGALTTLVQVEGGVDLARGELRDVAVTAWNRGRMTGYVWAERAKWRLGTRNWQLYNLQGASLADPANALVWTGAAGQTRERGVIEAVGPDDTIQLGTPAEVAAQERPDESPASATCASAPDCGAPAAT
jgi:hypothetical protein